MKQYEIYNGNRYVLTVGTNEDPKKVLDDERKSRNNYGLSLVMVYNGVRTVIEGPGAPPSEEDMFEDIYDEV